jgi:lauroyl/myristoyl acyltransferase
VVDEWPKTGHFAAVGLHWGPGGLIFRELNRNGYLPRVIFRRNVLVFAQQSRVENLYRRWRPKQYEKIGGEKPISTGSGYKKIVPSLNDKDVLIIFFDVPPEPTSNPIPVTMLGQPARLRSETINILAMNDVDYVKYRIGYNPQNGRRRFEISPAESLDDVHEIASDLANFMDSCIRKDLTQCYMWRFAPLYFD